MFDAPVMMSVYLQIMKICARIVIIFIVCICATARLAAQDVQIPDLDFSHEDNQQAPHDLAMPSSEAVPVVEKAQLELSVSLVDKGPKIEEGLIWRIYSPLAGIDSKLPLIAERQGGATQIDLEPGSYIIYVAFGRATATRRVMLQKGQHISESFVLDAGGLELNASLPEGKINEQLLSFTIYSDDSENDEQALIAKNIKPGVVTRLNAGTYHIVSNYGSANAIARSDIRVDAGKITEATLQHHAALVTLKLVRQEGGEALADTSWSITNDSGDIVRETVGAYATMVLAEGDYVAIAKNKDQFYQKAFSVSSGVDQEINLLADVQNQATADDDIDSVD